MTQPMAELEWHMAKLDWLVSKLVAKVAETVTEEMESGVVTTFYHLCYRLYHFGHHF